MILIGTKCQVEQTVTEALTASSAGSGALAVFGTPYMAAMMENAAPKKITTPTATVFTQSRSGCGPVSRT